MSSQSGNPIANTKQFIWDGTGIVEERDANNVTTRRYYAQGEQRITNGTATNFYYTRDHLGSIRELTDGSGAVRARYDYDPFGVTTKVSGDLEADFGYTGHYRHAASGLYLAPYRAYDPTIGRWLSRDPIEEAGGLNLYGYVENNPLNLVDPLGLDPGDPFDSPDAAARDALTHVNPMSILRNREYGGTIYQSPNGSYSWTRPVGGAGDRVNPLLSFPPRGAMLVVDYHTHGDYSKPSFIIPLLGLLGPPVRCEAADDAYGSDRFHGSDYAIYNALARNPAGVRTPRRLDALPYQIPISPGEYFGYLGTPSGRFLKYQASTGSTTGL